MTKGELKRGLAQLSNRMENIIKHKCKCEKTVEFNGRLYVRHSGRCLDMVYSFRDIIPCPTISFYDPRRDSYYEYVGEAKQKGT
jgi:hypothetical protein